MLTPLLAWEAQRAVAAGNAGLFAILRTIASAPLLALACDSLLQWLSSVSAYAVLALVTHLTATIVNVAKRLIIILAGIWQAAQGGQTSTANLIGVLLAIGGVLWYQLVIGSDRSVENNSICAEKERLSDLEAGMDEGDDAKGGGGGEGGARGTSSSPGGRRSTSPYVGLTVMDSSSSRSLPRVHFSVDGGGAAVSAAGAVAAAALGADPRLFVNETESGSGSGSGAISSADAGDARDAFTVKKNDKVQMWLSFVVLVARARGVPRTVLEALGLVPSQEKNNTPLRFSSERRSSSGEWTGVQVAGAGGGGTGNTGGGGGGVLVVAEVSAGVAPLGMPAAVCLSRRLRS